MGLVPIDRTRWPRRAHYEWVQKDRARPLCGNGSPRRYSAGGGTPLPRPSLAADPGRERDGGVPHCGNAGGFGDLRSYGPGLHGVSPPREKPFRCSGRPFIRIIRSSRQPISAMWRPTGLPRHGCPRASVRRIPSMSPWCPGCLFRRSTWRPPPSALICSPIFTLGKWVSQGEARVLPLTVQIHPGCVRSLPRSSAADAAPEGHCGVSPPVRKPWTFPAGLYIIKGTTL